MLCKGIIPAVVTPFDENQMIDRAATEKLVDHLLSHPVDGLFILGTNGEFHTLSNEEKVEFAKIVIAKTNKKVPVYVGVGSNSTREAVMLAKQMEAAGADALSVLTPFFIPPTGKELVLHYIKIAEAVSIPIILYNMPGKTGVNIDVDTLVELAKIPNIQGIKDSSGKLDNMKDYIAATKDMDFAVMSGSDSLILDVLLAGGTGAVAATSNFIPEIIVGIYQQFQQGNIEKARELQLAIEPFRAVLKLGTIPSVLKASLNVAGIQVGPARFPVTMPEAEAMKKIEACAKEYGK